MEIVSSGFGVGDCKGQAFVFALYPPWMWHSGVPFRPQPQVYKIRVISPLSGILGLLFPSYWPDKAHGSESDLPLAHKRQVTKISQSRQMANRPREG